MKLSSKLTYQAHVKGLDINKSDGVKIMNPVNKKYVHILPNGRICSNDILDHDKDLKGLMPEFLVKDPFLASGSFLALPVDVNLYIGKGASENDITFAKHCISQCFENMRSFNVIEDHDLQSSECKIEHEYVLSYKERQALIKACLEYLN